MAYSICVVVVSFLYIVLLELSKNQLVGWLLAILLAILMILTRIRLIRKKAFSFKCGLILWIAFVLLLGANYVLTAPPYRNVPAVENANPDTTDVVHLENGDITGVYNEDHSVRVFAGIPYAAPPVGELRFREPQPVENWDGVRACDTYAPMALQNRDSAIMDSLTHIIGYHDYRVVFGDEWVEPMSEDCLYLNVYAPAEEPKELLPVVLYIHGGSLMTGQAYSALNRGEAFAQNGVIMVNCAYRLNVFGYYAAEDLKEESPNGTTGNYGLLDQIAALKWVYDNIEAFGGDKNKITIAGESAGSSSVNALCVSPLTEGLFRYAIAESSSINAKKPFHTFRDYEKALEHGDTVRRDMQVSSSKELRDIPAEKLMKNSSVQDAMTIDGYAITEQPYLTYVKGLNHEKALLHGFNAKEADPFMLNVKATRDNYEEILEEVVGDYAVEMAQIVPWDSPQRDQHVIIDAMGEAKGAVNICYSAIWFSYSHHVWNRHLVEHGIPSYEYYFTRGNNSRSNYHAGELPYAYGNLWRFPGVYGSEDEELSETMVKYWTNFAKNGDPNGEGLPKWNMRSVDSTELLQLDTKIEMVQDPNEKIYEVIDKYQDSVTK